MYKQGVEVVKTLSQLLVTNCGSSLIPALSTYSDVVLIQLFSEL